MKTFRTELLRCPKCKNLPEIRIEHRTGRYYYVCTHCKGDWGVRISSVEDLRETIGAARKAWNRVVRSGAWKELFDETGAQ